MTSFTASFRVDGIPKAQPRPRAFARRMGSKFVARVFDAGTAEGWKSSVVAAARELRPVAPLETPLEVAIGFFLPRPKSKCRRADPDGPVPCTSKPDCDNLAKAVLDALMQDGWCRDDSQVVRLVVEKNWHAKDGRPGALIVVREIAA